GAGTRYTSLWKRDPGAAVLRTSGAAIPALQGLEDVVAEACRLTNGTTASLAVIKDGRLVYSRGFTYGPVSHALTPPSARFRIASVSKPLTAIAIMQLVEQGKLSLDDTLADVFVEMRPK